MVAKATQAAAAAKAQNATRAKTVKVYTESAFHRPRTLRLPKAPKYFAKAVRTQPRDVYTTIRRPLFTDSAMKQMEKANVLTFIVDLRATKDQVKTAVRQLYDVKAVRVNSLVTKRGEKKAYVKLDAATPALTVANRIGLI